MSNDKRKRIDKVDSAKICTAFANLNGKWDSLMSNPEIKEIISRLNLDEKFIRNHVANKNKKVKNATGHKIEKG
jgi:hypothetical protein